MATAPADQRVRLRAAFASERESVRNEKLGEVAAEFDAVHSVQRWLNRVVVCSGTMHHMSEHLSLRLQSPTATRLRNQAQRAGLPLRTLAQRYIDEGLRGDEHPLIGFVDGPTGRRAAVLGTGLDVWEVIATVTDNDNDLQEAATYLGVPLGLVQAAVTYYGAYTTEIDQQISANQSAWDDGIAALRRGEQALKA